jgi:two-component system response regulator FlrC
MRQGAADYLVKPFEPKALISLVERHAAGQLGASDDAGPVASSRPAGNCWSWRRGSRSDSTVLISGESGTGKEVLARYIHQQSPRAQPPLSRSTARHPRQHARGHAVRPRKGAFTGAIAAQAGKFEQAEGGTLLLDEISEMPLGLQAKLLRVLQEREVERSAGASRSPGYPRGRHHQPRPGRGSGGGALP